MAEQLVAEDDEEYPVFFYGGKEGEYAEFGQFARATFTVPHARIAAVLGRPVAKVAAIAGPDAATEITFSAAEQFMMYCKAVCFGDAKRRRLLLVTGTRLLAEAAPRDRIWGIGFGATNAMLNRDLWGQNLLGKALMMARDELRQEEAVEGERQEKRREKRYKK